MGKKTLFPTGIQYIHADQSGRVSRNTYGCTARQHVDWVGEWSRAELLATMPSSQLLRGKKNDPV